MLDCRTAAVTIEPLVRPENGRSAVTLVRCRLLRRGLFILAARMVVEGNIMTTSCLSTALMLVLSAMFTSACNADIPAEPTKFKASSLVLRDDVYRLWIILQSHAAMRGWLPNRTGYNEAVGGCQQGKRIGALIKRAFEDDR
jgi:hypothetical protein